MTSPGTIRLGAFLLQAPLARGGMGTVWRATHDGEPVAIKVMSTDAATRPDFVARFRDEVRAVAALDHPGIAVILDHGEVDVNAATLAEGRLSPGNPWLAMEYASGGTLAQAPAQPFSGLKRRWLAILDALAHAHARGVIHRDLKPGNILLAIEGDARPGMKLVDFGVAFARFEQDRTGPVDDQIVGTPQYMAPEQVRGDWRDYGPWTDLYALGCLAWWQLTGATPFASRTSADTLVGHLTRPVPTLMPRIPVPTEIEAWLGRLLEKDPSHRFQRAADAATALAAIGDVVEAVPSAVIPDLADTRVLTRLTDAPRMVRAAPSGARPPPAPVPPTWRRADPPPPPLALRSAGLRLHGLRQVPLVGRTEERDLLWEKLRAVADSGRAHVVVIRGAAGTGKSRLVEWLAERAHETGAASWCKATFALGQTPGEALRRMGVGFIRTRGLDRREVRDRVVHWLGSRGSTDTDEIEVLTELLCPATPADIAQGARPVRLTRFREYYAGTRNTMMRLSSERPLVAWFDDVQWGPHGIGLATQILRTQAEQPFPALVVMTVREDALAEDSIEADRLEKLLAMPDTTEIRLGPLARDAQLALAASLGLEPGLAAQVAERTAGNPLFAVQLVGSMVQRRALQAAAAGLTLRPGVRAELPDDVHAVWTRRIDELLGEFGGRESAAATHLEIAAVLGTPVDRREWRRACDDPDGFFGDRYRGEEPLRAQLVDRLIALRLAVRARDGWAFVHGMLEESLIRRARDAGRLAAHHAACAAALMPKAQDPTVSERLGTHLLRAGRHADAVEPLLRGVEVRLVSTGPLLASTLLSVAEEAAAVLPALDARRGRLGVLKASVLAALGETADAEAVIKEVLSRFPSAWRAREIRAGLRLRAGFVAEAEQEWAAIAATGDPLAQAHAARGRGDLLRRRRDPAAVSLLREAIAGFLALGAEMEAAATEAVLGRALAHSDAETARQVWESALNRYQAAGAGAGVAECVDHLARRDLQDGRLEDAEAGLRRALQRYEALGSTERALATRMRLALVLARTRRPSEIPSLVERAGASDPAGRPALAAAIRWVTASLQGDRPGWDRGFEETSRAVLGLVSSRSALAAEMVGWLGWIAAELLPAGEEARAVRALSGVKAIFQALGREDLVDELEGSRPRTADLAASSPETGSSVSIQPDSDGDGDR